MVLRSRRQFLQRSLALAGLGLLAGCGLLPSQAPPPRTPRIGFLGTRTGGGGSIFGAFRQGLSDLGYGTGKIDITAREAEELDRFPDLAAELVEREVEVIVVSTTVVAVAARQATSTIPIVVLNSGDPVASGLVASLAHPGGNVTGLASMAPQLSAKRLQLLKEAFPEVARVAVLWNPNDPDAVLGFQQTQAAAPLLGVQLLSLEVRGPGDFNRAFEAATGGRAEALMTLYDNLTLLYRAPIVSFATRARVPSMYDERSFFLDAGGLMAYGPNVLDLGRRAAVYVDKILKGARPVDLPIEQQTKFDFVINLKTAHALGMSMPQSVLMQATEVIQ